MLRIVLLTILLCVCAGDMRSDFQQSSGYDASRVDNLLLLRGDSGIGMQMIDALVSIGFTREAATYGVVSVVIETITQIHNTTDPRACYFNSSCLSSSNQCSLAYCDPSSNTCAIDNHTRDNTNCSNACYTDARCSAGSCTGFSATCQNSATCHTLGLASFQCTCASGYSGTRCETDINECASLPCLNGGTCVDRTGSFTCSCPAAYSGATCGVNIDECASAPCANNGVCSDGLGSFVCACASGFSGSTCRTNINDCVNNPCVNGGSCMDGIMSNVCACVPGYSGVLCQTEINECAPSPCNALNTQSCKDGINSFVCVCKAGKCGTLCEQATGCK